MAVDVSTNSRQKRRSAESDPTHDFVLATIQAHAGALLRIARRFSICADDAQDAYQRALEIFVRRADSLDPAGAGPWLRTVVKHEALAVRAARAAVLGPAEVDLDQHEATRLQTPDERIASFDRVTRSAEALQRLKPQEVRALVLKAEGHSYQEICELTGWTYTKVNRCLTEGRKHFFARYEGIESGAECERWAPVLSAVADGEASTQDLLAVRPHLRNCAGCRATLREFRGAPLGLGAVVPIGAVLASQTPAGSDPGLVMRVYEAVVGGVHERVSMSAQKLQAGAEAASTGKLAAVAASATAIAGGGVAVVDRRLADASQAGPVRVRVAAPARAAPADRALARADTGAAGAEPDDAREPGLAPTTARPSSPAAAPRKRADAQEFSFEAADSGPGAEATPPASERSSAAEPSTAAASASTGGGEFGP
jgi:RNA polymerase sigma factor (sigma-70 family)